jgi:hypothetical protein
MAIDIKNQEAIKKLTLDDLIADAVERGDAKALNWLEKEASTKKPRKKADGTKYLANKSIIEIRPLYLKKFLEYKPKASRSSEEAKKRKREEKEKELKDKFAEARAKMAKK